MLTLVVMVSLLLLLIALYRRLGIGREPARGGAQWCVNIPFSIYLGWISVATIANAADVLDYVRWNGWGLPPEAWFAVVMVVALLLTAVMSLTRGDIAYVLVIIWAFAGIAVKQAPYPVIVTTTWLATGAAGLLLLAAVWRRFRQPAAARPARG